MSHWTEWLRSKRLKEEFDDIDRPSDKFRFNKTNDDDVGGDYDKTRSELFRVVFDKYPEETLRFLHGIAERGDEEIKELLRQIEKGREPKELKEPTHPSEGDEVVPSTPDGGHSEGGEGGE